MHGDRRRNGAREGEVRDKLEAGFGQLARRLQLTFRVDIDAKRASQEALNL
jgi:hypothetical protein